MLARVDAVGRARIRRLEVDELVLRKLGIEAPPEPGPQKDRGQTLDSGP